MGKAKYISPAHTYLILEQDIHKIYAQAFREERLGGEDQKASASPHVVLDPPTLRPVIYAPVFFQTSNIIIFGTCKNAFLHICSEYLEPTWAQKTSTSLQVFESFQSSSAEARERRDS